MDAYQWLEQAKSELNRNRDRITIYGDHVTKGSVVDMINDVLESLENVDLDSVHDDCYSADSLQDAIDDEIERRETEKERKLKLLDPEEHRARWGVLNGGAA